MIFVLVYIVKWKCNLYICFVLFLIGSEWFYNTSHITFSLENCLKYLFGASLFLVNITPPIDISLLGQINSPLFVVLEPSMEETLYISLNMLVWSFLKDYQFNVYAVSLQIHMIKWASEGLNVHLILYRICVFNLLQWIDEILEFYYIMFPWIALKFYYLFLFVCFWVDSSFIDLTWSV